jgi:hypothetical protein
MTETDISMLLLSSRLLLHVLLSPFTPSMIIPMKLCICLLMLLSFGAAHAQRSLKESIPLQGATEMLLRLDDARLISIDTWDGDEVLITGTVTINNNENNEAFQVKVQQEASEIVLTAGIEQEDSLPQRITVHQNGQDYLLNASGTDDSVVQQFIREKGGYDWLSRGVQKDISLQVKVPARLSLRVENKFGTVEVARLTKAIDISNQFGDIDIQIDASTPLSLNAHTHFGTVYTDLDWNLKKTEEGLSLIKGSPMEGTLNGGGTPLQLDAKFGNVYLRRNKD